MIKIMTGCWVRMWGHVVGAPRARHRNWGWEEVVGGWNTERKPGFVTEAGSMALTWIRTEDQDKEEGAAHRKEERKPQIRQQ